MGDGRHCNIGQREFIPGQPGLFTQLAIQKGQLGFDIVGGSGIAGVTLFRCLFAAFEHSDIRAIQRGQQPVHPAFDQGSFSQILR